jgi:hypothetical protein
MDTKDRTFWSFGIASYGKAFYVVSIIIGILSTWYVAKGGLAILFWSTKAAFDSGDTEYPEGGITDPIKNLHESVWSHGYSCKLSGGTWYELYLHPRYKRIYDEPPRSILDLSDPENHWIASFAGINTDHFADDSQITFFVPNHEKVLNLDEMTEIFV